jgi:hypothetical protein
MKPPPKFQAPAIQIRAEGISDNLKKSVLEAGFPGDTGDWKLFKDVIYSTSTDVQVL